MTDVTEMPTPESLAAEGEVVFDAEWSGAQAGILRRAIDASMRDSARSQWAESNHLGISDIGGCREYVRRMILGLPWVDEQENYAAAFVGTAVGEFAERAVLAAYPDTAQVQLRVTVEVTVRGYTMELPGTADITLGRKVLLDTKTKDGLGVVKRTGPTLQQVFQVTLYAAALIAAGELDEDCHVGLAYIDRSGREPQPWVYGWRYDPAILSQAKAWLDDVVYAVENNETASKDQPRTWCFECCPYASDCRGMDSDVTGLLTDPEVVEAARVYKEANAEIKRLEKDKKSAVSVMENKAGHTGEYTIRWIDVPETTIDSFTRRGYRRIDVRETRSPKRKRGESEGS